VEADTERATIKTREDIMANYLMDIDRLLNGEIRTVAGPTMRVDKMVVHNRFGEQITEFARLYTLYREAKDAARRQKLEDSHKIVSDSRYRTGNVPCPEKGLVWHRAYALCVPDRDGEYNEFSAWVRPETELPADPTDWELNDDLPCAYATLATIHDQAERIPNKRIHNKIWSAFLFAWMLFRVEQYDETRLEKALSIVKADLLSIRYRDESGGTGGKKPAGAPKKPAQTWKPPRGYIGSQEIINTPVKDLKRTLKLPCCDNETYKIPRSTLQHWQDCDSGAGGTLEGQVKNDPKTHEVYVRKKWLKDRLPSYKPKKLKS